METKAISDLGEITAFDIFGYSPIDRVKNGRRVEYIYDWSDELQQLHDDWLANRGDMGMYKRYHLAMKSVKQAIFQLEDHRR